MPENERDDSLRLLPPFSKFLGGSMGDPKTPLAGAPSERPSLGTRVCVHPLGASQGLVG